MSNPKVSVAIATLNRLEYLKNTVRSVLDQTLSDFEIIISNNCSNDGTKKWAEYVSKKYSKIRYLRNKKNLGMVDNWNKGLSREMS